MHAGFRGALDSIAQRLKQLTLYAAAEGEGRGLDEATPADALDGWERVVTAHSVGNEICRNMADESLSSAAGASLLARSPRPPPSIKADEESAAEMPARVVAGTWRGPRERGTRLACWP